MSTDTDAMAVLSAEHECEVIEIIAEHAPLSDIACDRIDIALDAIRTGLNVRRRALRLPVLGAQGEQQRIERLRREGDYWQAIARGVAA